MSIGPLSYPTPLPTFSSLVQSALTDGTVQKVWDLFIREATDFYFPDMPQEDGKARVVYQHIGRTMYDKYPCIGSEGQTPWVRWVVWLDICVKQGREGYACECVEGRGTVKPAL